ncbi:flagellar hook assembly protein FlgD [Sphingomonas solaris]|uniref:Basal-body rod modification protein FlgD n=1 Tax=Alterirhizorhabdus solaris TaxID=2529389 RepID=A0A558QUW7_9SPHN|nr:flagellar hook capping FlgD N-terminal domain-containing protein [Sphingomonas solaris]TVV70924.1 flagellar hook capping protein [Sphingomonas solaris]
MTTVTNNTATLALATTTAAKTATAAKSGTLDQSSFLKLMTTQLKTQDPFDPVDNTQMVAQMAQFSSVAGISEMNTSLKTIASDIAGSRVGDAASWIGRSALVDSTTATPLSDGTYAGEVTLAKDATNVGISLVSEDGAVVKEFALGKQPAGPVSFAGDGRAADGTSASGPLKVVVTAAAADGRVTSTTATWAGISAVQSPAGGTTTKLVTSLGLISPTDAQRLG